MKFIFYLQGGIKVDSLPKGYSKFYITEDVESPYSLDKFSFPNDSIQYDVDSLCVELYGIFQCALFPSQDDYYNKYKYNLNGSAGLV